MNGKPTPQEAFGSWEPPDRRKPAVERRLLWHDRRLNGHAGLPVLGTEEMAGLTPAFDLLPYAEAVARRCLLLWADPTHLLLVTESERAGALLPWADAYLQRPFRLVLAGAADIQALLARYHEKTQAMDDFSQSVAGAGLLPAHEPRNGTEKLRLESIQAERNPVVRLTNSTLYDAYRSGVSDIHLETTRRGLRVRYRHDGVLATIADVEGEQFAEQVISRIKVMAELDIAERRIPQDGRFKVNINEREVDFRVSIMPSILGEDAVLRILDKQAIRTAGGSERQAGPALDSLGFDPDCIHQLRRLAREPYGMLLVTGPTGSGKTTTLYALINEVNNGRDKIITIEDPVEYQFADVLQIPVNERKGLTFARGLRSILRHDPDKIMVGEIRDDETAQIAVQSALTGHLVFSTVHANNSLDIISRFLHMGVAPRSFAAAINGILAQRLVRLNCSQCSVPLQPDAALLADSGLEASQVQDFHFMDGKGCPGCRSTGFQGRLAIGELLRMSDRMRALIVEGVSQQRLFDEALREGMSPLRTVAIDLVRQGKTTLEEINRVTFVD